MRRILALVVGAALAALSPTLLVAQQILSAVSGNFTIGIAAGTCAREQFNASNTTWYRVQ